MAIKLMGVEGATLFDEPRAKTQDFLLINQPMFGFGDVATYLKVTQLQLQFKDNNGSDLRRPVRQDPASDHRADEPARHRQDRGDLARIGGDKMSNPLDGPYFRPRPFCMEEAMRRNSGVTRRDPENRPIDEFPSDNALRQAMKHSLSITDGKPVVYDFPCSLRPDGLSPGDAAFPIEDAASSGRRQRPPLSQGRDAHHFAAGFRHPLRITECEHLVFTPWHGLTEHQPLGGINRLRRAVYIASSQYRPSREPSKFPVDYPK